MIVIATAFTEAFTTRVGRVVVVVVVVVVVDESEACPSLVCRYG